MHFAVSAKEAFIKYRQDILQATADMEPERLMKEMMQRKVLDEFSLAEVLTKDKEQSHQENFQRDIVWDAVEEELGRDQKKLMYIRDVLEAITKESRERDSLVMKLDNFNGQHFRLHVLYNACHSAVADLLCPSTAVNPAQQAFQHHKAGLYHVLENPAQYTESLLQYGLITKPVADAILNDMLSKLVILFAVECQLKNDDHKFHKLCSVLKRFPATLQIAEEMNQTFERCGRYPDALQATGKTSNFYI